MPQESIRVFAGDCTVTDDGDEHRRQRGSVVVLVKPDHTVLVHDGDGYQPVEWLTRADAVHCVERENTFAITVVDDGTQLRVESHETYADLHCPASVAGVPVGTCSDCGGVLVRAGGGVTCPNCGVRFGVPRDAELLEDPCDCGLPRMVVERGAAFEVCVDRDCESLDATIKERFDREWDCPDCQGDLRIIRRGGLLAGCERYPECEVGFSLPAGIVVDTCDCGLPVFETASGRRCLDATCEYVHPDTDG
jgi:DNA topoisomerase-1